VKNIYIQVLIFSIFSFLTICSFRTCNYVSIFN